MFNILNPFRFKPTHGSALKLSLDTLHRPDVQHALMDPRQPADIDSGDYLVYMDDYYTIIPKKAFHEYFSAPNGESDTEQFEVVTIKPPLV